MWSSSGGATPRRPSARTPMPLAVAGLWLVPSPACALGLGGDLEEWAPSPLAPGGWRPMERPWLETLR
eukprot:10777261-Lingulodinium_polyedra.AAC.1